jgi:hypothetical protein
VTSDQAPTGASLHLAIGRRGFESLDDPAWRQWVRVIQDDAVPPLADALVGAEPYVGTPVQGGTLDVPVLVDCPAGAPCERGYWLVFQNFAAAPRPAAWGPDRPPAFTRQDDVDRLGVCDVWRDRRYGHAQASRSTMTP